MKTYNNPEGTTVVDDKLLETLMEQSRELIKLKDLPRKEVISVQPGDVLVFSCDDHLDDIDIESFRRDVARIFPSNDHMLLEDGLSLEVYREQERP